MRFSVACCLLTIVCGSASAQQARTQILFKEPSGMKVFWLTKENGKTVYSTTPLNVPGRFNFVQGAVYQLKLTHLEGHPGLVAPLLIRRANRHCLRNRHRDFDVHLRYRHRGGRRRVR